MRTGSSLRRGPPDTGGWTRPPRPGPRRAGNAAPHGPSAPKAKAALDNRRSRALSPANWHSTTTAYLTEKDSTRPARAAPGSEDEAHLLEESLGTFSGLFDT